MKPSLVNAMLRKRPNKARDVLEEVSTSAPQQQSGIDNAEDWNVLAAVPDSTTGNLDSTYWFPEQGFVESTLNTFEAPSSRSSLLSLEDRKYMRLMKSLIVKSFINDPRDTHGLTPLPSSFSQSFCPTESEKYNIPVSYLSLGSIASVDNSDIVEVEAMVKRQEEILAAVKEGLNFSEKEIDIDRAILMIPNVVFQVMTLHQPQSVFVSKPRCKVWALLNAVSSDKGKVALWQVRVSSFSSILECCQWLVLFRWNRMRSQL